MSVLNVKPQSVDGGPHRPPQRRDVTLNDHHRSWLANYNEIRLEVNHSTAYNQPRTIVYRNEHGSFGANSVFAEQMVFGSSNPYSSPTNSPITINSTQFSLSSAVTMSVQGPAQFGNNVNFAQGTVVTIDGSLVLNGKADFKDLANFYALTTFHPSSVLKVDGLSYFNNDVTVAADMDMTGTLTLVGDIVQTGNTKITGNLEVTEDLIVRGDLTVLGDKTTLEVTELVVEDKNIVVNKNDVYTPLDAGLFIQKGTVQDAGYYKVHHTLDSLLQLKAPTGNILTIDVTNKDVSFKLLENFAADQELLTTSNVAFREVKVDVSSTRHNDVPSYTQQNDPIAAGKGWVSTPWVYSNAVEASDNLVDANTTGLYMGTGTFTIRDEISLVSKGKPEMFLDYHGNVGFGTRYPVSDLHLFDNEPSFTISTNNYTSNATIAFTDFSERVDDAGMYMSFDANTGCGILELTTESYNTELKISVGGHQKTPEISITDDRVNLNDDLFVYGDGYVQDNLIVDDTLYVRKHKVGVNVTTPAHELDISGTIQGDSDLILNGTEPFVLIGAVTSLEPMGRSGIAIQEDSPLIQLSTTELNYRHGSIVQFNDSVNDSNWVIGTSKNGDKLDLGKSFARTANTPEYGLDEYYGETLLRFSEDDQAEMYLQSDTSNAALTLNTRTNGIHLYLGEQNSLLTTPRSTLAYGANAPSSVVQWHGSSSTMGELSYFPNGNDDSEFGSFRFSRTDGTVNQGVPSAKVGANQFYANDKIGISQTTPTAELHITKNYSEALLETEDNDTFIKLSTNDSTSEAILKGEHTSGSSHFQLKASNPASLDLVSGTHSLKHTANNVSQEIKIDLSETSTPSSYIMKTVSGQNDLTVTRPGMTYNVNLTDTNQIIKEDKQTPTMQRISEINETSKTIYLTSKSASLEKRFDLNETAKTITELNTTANLKRTSSLNETTKTIVHESNVHSIQDISTITNNDIIHRSVLAANKLYNLEIGQTENNLKLTRETSDFDVTINSNDLKLKLLNGNNNLQLHNEAVGNSSMMFTGDRFTFKRDSVALFNAYENYIDFVNPVNFKTDVLVEGALTANNGVTFPSNNPNNKIEFNLTSSEGTNNNSNTPLTNYIKWTCNTDEAEIFFASGGDTTTISWGDTSETVSSSRVVTKTGDNGTEGIEFKSSTKELLFLDHQYIYGNVPIMQTHAGTLIEYENTNKWLLKDKSNNDGIYWNKGSGAYSFSSNLTEYTSTENANNQIVFTRGGAGKASVDLDTGSIRSAGDLVADNDIIGFVTSDRNYKENITDMSNALDKIDLIRGVEFDWKENPSGYHGHDVGVIAQEIEEVIPEAIRTGANGQKQVNYDKIIPLLIECIKELKQKL